MAADEVQMTSAQDSWLRPNLAASSHLPSASEATSYGAGEGMSPVVFSPADSVSSPRCVPFRYRANNDETSGDKPKKLVEGLMINSQSGPGLLFPKGGWENDETVEEAAAREAIEEAGVRGDIVDETLRNAVWASPAAASMPIDEIGLEQACTVEDIDLARQPDPSQIGDPIATLQQSSRAQEQIASGTAASEVLTTLSFRSRSVSFFRPCFQSLVEENDFIHAVC